VASYRSHPRSSFKRPGHRITGRSVGYSATWRAGWEFVHVEIDGTSRVAYLEILADEKVQPASRSCDERSRGSQITASRSNAL
jgi:hypothetical protein